MIQEIKILKKLEDLTGEGSQKSKQNLIKDSLTPCMEYILDICFNPFVTTKLHKINFKESPDPQNPDLWKDFQNLIEDLKKAPAANDFLRGRAEKLISSRLSEDNSEDTELN